MYNVSREMTRILVSFIKKEINFLSKLRTTNGWRHIRKYLNAIIIIYWFSLTYLVKDILGRDIPKTKTMVLDVSLFGTVLSGTYQG